VTPGSVSRGPDGTTDAYQIVCDGTPSSRTVKVDPGALFTVITLSQGTAARAGFSVWE
jgi:hypothetical protein